MTHSDKKYNLLFHRASQYVALILILALAGGGYWYWKNARAAVQTTDNRPSFEAPLTHDLNLTRGQGSATYSRIDGADRRATVTDFAGLIRPVKSGEARFEGARRVENLFSRSESFDISPWSGGATITTANAGEAPDGTTSAEKLTFSDAANQYVNQSVSWTENTTYVFSIWIKGAAGKKVRITLQTSGGAGSSGDYAYQQVTLNGTWQRFSSKRSTGTGHSSVTAGLYNWTGDNGGSFDVYAWGAQFEDVTGQANQNPSEYVSTNVKTSSPYHGAGVDGVKYFDTQNGNTVASNVVTEATGAAIAQSTLKGYLAEGARTNLLTYSEQFDNAAWTKTNITVNADSTVAPNGQSVADKIVENAANVTHWTRQVQSKGASSLPYAFTVYLKAASRSRAEIWLHDGTGSGAYIFVDLTNGSITGPTLSGAGWSGATAISENKGNGWYRVQIVATSNAAVFVEGRVYPNDGTAGHDTAYTGDGSSGIYAWGAQLEQARFASSYIPTTTASVTRASDSLSYPETGNFGDATGTVSLETTPNWSGGLGWNAHWVADSSSGYKLRLWHWQGSANHIGVDRSANNGATRNAVDSSLTLTQGTMIKIATKYDGTAVRQFNNGVLAGSDTTLTLPYDSLSNSLYIGSNGVGEQAFSTIRNVRAWKKALSDTELNNLTSLTQSTSDSATKKTTIKAPNNTGLVGYWSFEDGSGTQATDFSGNANTGTFTNGPTWIDGKFGKAVNFDGVNDYVDVGNAASLQTSIFTYTVWVKPSPTGSNIRTLKGTINNAGPQFRIENTNALGLIKENVINIGTSIGTIPNDAWSHVAVSYDASGNYVFYINGVAAGSGTNLQTFTFSNHYIGGKTNMAVEQFAGSIDDFRIYNRVLSAAEVSDLYQTTASTKLNTSQNSQLTSGLVGLWSFNGPDISGTTAYDRSGNANNGTLTNGPTPTIGKVGQALNFNGTNSFVNLPNVATLKPTGDYAVAFWYKGLKGSTETFIGHSSSVLSNFWYINNTKAYFCGGTGCNSSTEKTYTLPNDDSWHHLVASLDRNASPDTLTVYIDSVSQGTTSGTANGAPTWGSNTLIGAPSWNNSGYRQGPMDEVRIYNRALTQTEVSALYNLGR